MITTLFRFLLVFILIILLPSSCSEDPSFNIDNDVLSFSIEEQLRSAKIDAINHHVDIEVVFATDISNLKASFSLSDGAIAKVNNVVQESGITANDFTNPVTFSVIAEDGVTTQDWLVTVVDPLITGAVDDIDGNTYATVQIGTQTWMAEDLKTTRYNDDTPITLVTDNTAWINSTTEAFCWYNNDEATYKPDYGALYNWYAVNTKKLCPTGWHVPSDEEWKTMEIYLGLDQAEADLDDYRGNVGGKLKEAGTVLWSNPNTGATNASGFTALPGGGRRYDDGSFLGIGLLGYWGCSLLNIPGEVPVRFLSYDNEGTGRGSTEKNLGLSIRCLKD